jgi:hypothetical protein
LTTVGDDGGEERHSVSSGPLAPWTGSVSGSGTARNAAGLAGLPGTDPSAVGRIGADDQEMAADRSEPIGPLP